LQNLQDRLAFRSSHNGSIILFDVFVAEGAGGRTAPQLQSSLDHVGWWWEVLKKDPSSGEKKKKKMRGKRNENEMKGESAV